jgi:3-dehydro-L-gulonate 2-dehydrogenase
MPDSISIFITATEMQATLQRILQNNGFDENSAAQCAAIFTANSLDGVYTHGINRFPRFIEYVQKGFVKCEAVPSLKNKFHGIEQWNGNLGPGPLNAVQATNTAMKLSKEYGIGCVALSNTNHWMRGGTYGWQAAKAGFVFVGWTNTIANMPAWGAKDARLGNNPLVIAVPYNDNAIVLDMAMSQYSFGAMELAVLKNEKLPLYAGFDTAGKMTDNPAAILESRRPLPVGYWKGAGLALLLDILATILSGGLSTQAISSREVEYGLSQVFIAIDISKLGPVSAIAAAIENIITDYKQSIPATEKDSIAWPGERVLMTRKKNLEKGIPVIKRVWEEVMKL